MQLFLFFILLPVITLAGVKKNNASISLSGENIHIISADYIYDFESCVDISGLFDYAFTGRITKELGKSFYNGTETNIPYTFYEVQVIDPIKGDVGNRVKITFYGGYDINGDLVLFEGGNYPLLIKNIHFTGILQSLPAQRAAF